MIKHKHQQLFELMVEEFRSGAWPDGCKLPSQKELALRYSVSVNVVSQTIELLKQRNLVKVKMGDGIYSTCAAPAEDAARKYSGERLFGRYAGAKTLNVLVEDHMDWQLEFWNGFFDQFARENPDVELNVRYDHGNSAAWPPRFDVVIGSFRFLAGSGVGSSRLSHRTAAEFFPDFDENVWLKTGEFSEGIFPVGVISSYLLCALGTPVPRPRETMLDYVERATSPGEGAVLMRLNTELFQNSGIDVLNRARRPFDEAEKVRIRRLFDRSGRLYREGRLLWEHGFFSDPAQLDDRPDRRRIAAMEWRSNYPAFRSPEQYPVRTPYPHGERAMVVPVLAVIDDRTCFPEEPLRLVRKLRSLEVQRAANRARVFEPIRIDAMPEDSGLAGYWERGEVEFKRDFDLIEIGLNDCLLGWELLYNLTGGRDGDPVEMLDRKVRYYYRNADKYPEFIHL